MQKSDIRLSMKSFLASLSPQHRHARSQAVCTSISHTKPFRDAQLIMLYMPLPSEVETSPLAIHAWTLGKQIAVPRVDWNHHKMDPVQINSLDFDATTSQGIRQPADGCLVPLDLIDMVIIPGIAFDRRGYRVGRGRGFYDRFLSQSDFQGTRCAICFHEQLIPQVPAEPHDVPMDLLITDQETLHFPHHHRH